MKKIGEIKKILRECKRFDSFIKLKKNKMYQRSLIIIIIKLWKCVLKK